MGQASAAQAMQASGASSSVSQTNQRAPPSEQNIGSGGKSGAQGQQTSPQQQQQQQDQQQQAAAVVAAQQQGGAAAVQAQQQAALQWSQGQTPAGQLPPRGAIPPQMSSAKNVVTLVLPGDLERVVHHVCAQLEHYFSPQNLQSDQYLRAQMDDNGYVMVAVLMGFNRLAAISTDPRAILYGLLISRILETSIPSSELAGLLSHPNDAVIQSLPFQVYVRRKAGL